MGRPTNRISYKTGTNCGEIIFSMRRFDARSHTNFVFSEKCQAWSITNNRRNIVRLRFDHYESERQFAIAEHISIHSFAGSSISSLKRIFNFEFKSANQPRIECTFVCVQLAGSELLYFVYCHFTHQRSFVHFFCIENEIGQSSLPSPHWTCAVTIWLIKFKCDIWKLLNTFYSTFKFTQLFVGNAHCSIAPMDQLIIHVEFESRITTQEQKV